MNGEPYKSIGEEAHECREAWRAAPGATIAHRYSHNRHYEPLLHPAKKRIGDILKNKPKLEQAERLHHFRPYLGPISPAIAQGTAGWRWALAKMKRADAGWPQYTGEWKRADAEYQRDTAGWRRTLEGGGEYHAANFPDCTWGIKTGRRTEG